MAKISGLISDKKRNALGDIEVTIDGDAGTPTPATNKATSGADGIFEFANLAPGEYTIKFTQYVPLPAPAVGFRVLPKSGMFEGFDLGEDDEEEAVERIYETQQHAITGEVKDDKGNSLEGVEVFLDRTNPTDSIPSPPVTSVVSKAGVYSFPGLVNGKYTVTFATEAEPSDGTLGDDVLLILTDDFPQTESVRVKDKDFSIRNARLYKLESTPVPPRLVRQRASRVQKTWEESGQRLTRLASISLGVLVPHRRRFSELAEVTGVEATWLKSIRDVRRAEAAPLLRTLGLRVLEKSSIVRGQLIGLATSVGQIINGPDPPPNTSRLDDVKFELESIEKLLDAMDQLFQRL